MVGSLQKTPKIKALTKMIPSKKEEKKEFDNYGSLFVPIPSQLLEIHEEEKHYLVPKTMFNLLVTGDDVNDWAYLLARFTKLLDNLNKLLNNIRKLNYAKIIDDKNFEKILEKRKIKVTEKILEKVDEKKERKAKPKLSLELKKKELELIMATAGLMLTQNGPVVVDPLDAATIGDAKASGADLIAAAHLATLEASSPQHAADVMQVILNRAKGQSGGVIAVITAQEQFTPYSSAIYGKSIDKNAERTYGHLRVTKKEIVEIAKTQGLRGLIQRFGGYGSASVAEKVLQDFKSKGPLSQSSASFVGGAQYFMGYATNLPGERRRPDGGNYFRDSYSTGAIIMPELIKNHVIWYNTNDTVNNISKFIVDKPSIIDVQKVGEPLVIIPTERPIGKTILNMIFREPFQIIDQIFKKETKAKEQKVNPQTPIKNRTTSINRTTIPQSQRQLNSYESSDSVAETVNQTLYDQNIKIDTMLSSVQQTPKIQTQFLPIDKIMTAPSYVDRKNNIDSISQKTDDVFGPKVLIVTQDIFVTEE